MEGSLVPPTPKKPEPVEVVLPEDRQDATEEWKRAYKYALDKGNTEKAAKQWADGHFEDDEYAS